MTILAIDPGTERTGYALKTVDLADSPRVFTPDGHGTFYGKGTTVKRIADIAGQVMAMVKEYKVDALVIEEYQMIPGKVSGIYAVPGLISVLTYLWYTKKKTVPIMVYPATWKAALCGSAGASKAVAREGIIRILPHALVKKIDEDYAKRRGSNTSDEGEQDCYDAISILYWADRTVRDGYLEESMKWGLKKFLRERQSQKKQTDKLDHFLEGG